VIDTSPTDLAYSTGLSATRQYLFSLSSRYFYLHIIYAFPPRQFTFPPALPPDFRPIPRPVLTFLSLSEPSHLSHWRPAAFPRRMGNLTRYSCGLYEQDHEAAEGLEGRTNHAKENWRRHVSARSLAKPAPAKAEEAISTAPYRLQPEVSSLIWNRRWAQPGPFDFAQSLS
jgi:hypothetical protein